MCSSFPPRPSSHPRWQPTSLFPIISTVFSAHRANRGRGSDHHSCTGGKLGDFHAFFSLLELDTVVILRWGNRTIAAGCTSEAGPGSQQESSHALSLKTVLEVVAVLEPGRDARELVEALRSRPHVLRCTVLSSLMSPPKHTASSHTSKVKCGCFNH